MGYIEGGWGFVGAAYAVTAVAFITYTLSVFLRFRAERARAEREAQRAPEVSS
jgi:Na+-driven multidrug efflux pump